jgi:hypothetical protein
MEFTSCSSYIKELEAYGFLYFRIFYYACCYFLYYAFVTGECVLQVTAALTFKLNVTYASSLVLPVRTLKSDHDEPQLGPSFDWKLNFQSSAS